MVYLIHLDRPLYHARHYVGFTTKFEGRMHYHRHETQHFFGAINRAGIAWDVVRTWEDGDRALERRIKNSHNASRFCPICQAERKNK